MSTLTLPAARTVAEAAAVAHLPAAARADLEFWRARLEPLLTLKGGLKPALEAVARETHTPYHTVKRRFLCYRKNGLLGSSAGGRYRPGLLDRRLAGRAFWFGATPRTQPDAIKSAGLIELWKLLCEQAHRSCKRAHARLVAMWRRRDERIAEIPEYRDFPGWPLIPKGWSYDNLIAHRPSDYELTVARQGRAAAALHRPTVFTTRVGLYPGSHYVFDDKWHDFFVNDLRARQQGRPLEVYALDLFSAYKLPTWGFKLRERTEDGDYKGIGEVMMRYVLAATLHTVGYSPRGTTLLTEAGTAKVRAGLAEILKRNTGGKIHLEEGAVRAQPGLLQHYPGIAKGNPRHKAALESNNNLEHNHFDDLPAQTGRNRQTRPEGLDGAKGLLGHNAALLAAYDQLPADKQALFDFPLLERNQFADLATQIYGNIANDRDHKLEGWIEAGNITQLIEIAGVTVTLGQLTPAQREALPELLEKGAVTARPVRMTRREAFERGRGDLVKLPGWGVVAILGEDLARESRVRDNMFEIQDAEIGAGLFRYESMIRTAEGVETSLRDGAAYRVFVNPFAPDTLFVCDEKGAFLGESRRITAPCRTDVEGIQNALAAASRREGQLLAPMRARHAGAAKEKLERHRNNAGVMAGEVRAETKATREKAQTAKELMLARGAGDEDAED